MRSIIFSETVPYIYMYFLTAKHSAMRNECGNSWENNHSRSLNKNIWVWPRQAHVQERTHEYGYTGIWLHRNMATSVHGHWLSNEDDVNIQPL